MLDLTVTESLDLYAGSVWTPAALVEIRPLPPEFGVRRWVAAEKIPALAAALSAENSKGANLFAGILPRTRDGGGTDFDCAAGWAVWSDFDGVTPEAALERAAAAGLPAVTLAVNSGHGVHLFWGLHSPAEPADLSALVGDLAALVGSDPTVRNPSRILRLPGFWNRKEPKARAGIVLAEPGRRYEFAELRALVPVVQVEPEPPAPVPARAPTAPDRLKLLDRAARYMDKVPGAAEGGRNDATYRAAAVLRNDFALSAMEARPILAAWNAEKNRPPLAERELSAVLDAGGKYAKKPAGAKADAPPPARAPAREPDLVVPLPEATESALAEEFAAEGRGERQSLPLPWPRVSSAIGGLRPGTVVIIGGPAGYGKSLLAMQAALALQRGGHSWAFLPMEDSRQSWERRALAMLAQSWSVLSDAPDTADYRAELLAEHSKELAALVKHVVENPRLPMRGPDGFTVPPLPYSAVLDWTARALERARVVFIDPLAQIDFPERQSWIGEGDFVRRLVGLAAASGGSIVLVAHTIKRPGHAGSLMLTAEDLQGAAALNRLVHTILLLEAHDEKTSQVWQGEMKIPAIHDRTMTVAKCRFGPGRGVRVAMRLYGPHLEELGAIARGEADQGQYGREGGARPVAVAPSAEHLASAEKRPELCPPAPDLARGRRSSRPVAGQDQEAAANPPPPGATAAVPSLTAPALEPGSTCGKESPDEEFPF
jgi:hypothetical protein